MSDLGIPSFSDFIEIAPTATLSVVLVGVGWYARGKSAQQTFEVYDKFIDYIKSLGRRSGD